MSTMAKIGTEEECEATLPADSYGSLSQRVFLPDLECEAGLLLTYHYRIQSYDVAWGKIEIDEYTFYYGWIDPFVVYIRDRNGAELARFIPAGNRTDFTQWEDCGISGSFYDSGWQAETVDLTKWAGQEVYVDFRTENGADIYWPTWTLIDNIRLIPSAGRIVRVPLVLQTGGLGLARVPAPQSVAPEPAVPALQGRSGRPSRR
jgi:hypothetical protein